MGCWDTECCTKGAGDLDLDRWHTGQAVSESNAVEGQPEEERNCSSSSLASKSMPELDLDYLCSAMSAYVISGWGGGEYSLVVLEVDQFGILFSRAIRMRLSVSSVSGGLALTG